MTAKTAARSCSVRIELPTGPLDPAHCVLRHVSRLSRAVAASFDQALAPVELTGHQFNLMMTLYRSGPSLVGRLAHLVGMHGSSVPRAVAPLAARGWIAVARGQDRRERILTLTAEGEARLATALPIWTKLQQNLVARMGADMWLELTPKLKLVGEAAKSALSQA